MKLEIDLNKLSLDELSLVVRLAEKQTSQKSDASDIDDDIVVVPTKPPKKKRRNVGLRYGKEYWNKKMEAIHADIEKGMARTPAFKKHLGYAANTISEKYKKYVRKLNKVDGRGKTFTRLNEIASVYILQGYSRKSAFAEAGKQYKAEKKREERGMIRQKPVLPVTADEQRARLANKEVKQQVPITPPASYEQPFNVNQKAPFPHLSTVHDKYVPLLKTMLNNVVNTDTEGIGYYIEGVMLEITLEDYHKFLYEFMVNATKIADYFGVINKFKVITKGKERRIIYDKRQSG